MSDFDEIFEYVLKKQFFLDTEFVRKHSYVHPNGFTKLVLPASRTDIEEFRLHFWPVTGISSDIHNHTSGFKSLVIQGEIREELFDEAAGENFVIYKCSERDVTGAANLEPVRKCNLLSREKIAIRKGQSYEISAETLHRVTTPRGIETVTLVAQLAKQRDHSFVAKSSSSSPRSIGLENPPLTASATADLLGLCYDLMERYMRTEAKSNR